MKGGVRGGLFETDNPLLTSPFIRGRNRKHKIGIVEKRGM